MMHHRRALHRRRPRQRLTAPLIAMPHATPRSRSGEGMVPMRALTLIYHEDLEPEITGIVQQTMLVARYTKVRDVIGARTDIMQDVDYAANGQNHMLIIVATQEVILELAHALRLLRQVKGHGLRGYITPVEGLI